MKRLGWGQDEDPQQANIHYLEPTCPVEGGGTPSTPADIKKLLLDIEKSLQNFQTYLQLSMLQLTDITTRAVLNSLKLWSVIHDIDIRILNKHLIA